MAKAGDAPSPHRSAKPGDNVVLGTYPHRADGADQTPIKWRVLRNSGTELFVLSEYIVDCRRYHGEQADISWHGSDLRKWLNDEFYNAAFDDAEKRIIRTSLCADNGEGSPDTEDNVFVLSVPEAKQLTDKLAQAPCRVRRRAIGTDYSKRKTNDGCKLYVYDKQVQDDYVIENGEPMGCSWWWLRTQPDRSPRAYFIGPRSSIRSYGRVDLACYGVRPAIKIDLSSL